MARILVFGGCFDPIAVHHLSVLSTVMTRSARGTLIKTPGLMKNVKPFIPFQEAWILPYNKDPNNQRELTPIDQRIEMIELALKDFDMEDYVKVSDFEEFFNIECGRTKALLKFDKFYSQNDFTFLQGVDEAMLLRSWKSSRKLTRDLTFLTVGRRNGHGMAAIRLRQKNRYFQMSDWYYHGYGPNGHRYIGENIESSNIDCTHIRKELSMAGSHRQAMLCNTVSIPESVGDYIKSNKLYTQGDQQ